jgi:hypothetical protein
MKPSTIVVAGLGALLAASLAAGAGRQAPADVAGTWTLQVETSQGGGTPTFVFKQEGEKIEGNYKGLFGEAPVTGTVKGQAITFSITVSVEGMQTTITYEGTVDKDSMKGTVQLGELAEGTFTGQRQKAR